MDTSPDVPGAVAERRRIVPVAEITQRLPRKIIEFCLDRVEPLLPASSNLQDAGDVDPLVPMSVRRCPACPASDAE